MITNNMNICAMHIGNSEIAPIITKDRIHELAVIFASVFSGINSTIWLPIMYNFAFAKSTKKIIMHKKIWKNPDFCELRNFESHSPERVIFESNDIISFMTIIKVSSEELVTAYDMIVSYKKNKFLMILPPEENMFGQLDVIANLFRKNQTNGVINIDEIFYDVIHTMENVIISTCWGFADDWDCGISFYARKNNPLFDTLSQGVKQELERAENKNWLSRSEF